MLLHGAGDVGDDRCAARGEDVVALVGPAAGPGLAVVVRERVRALHRAHPRAAGDGPGRLGRRGRAGCGRWWSGLARRLRPGGAGLGSALLGDEAVELGHGRLLFGSHTGEGGPLLLEPAVEAVRRGDEVLAGGAVAVDGVDVADGHVAHHRPHPGQAVDVLVEQQHGGDAAAHVLTQSEVLHLGLEGDELLLVTVQPGLEVGDAGLGLGQVGLGLGEAGRGPVRPLLGSLVGGGRVVGVGGKWQRQQQDRGHRTPEAAAHGSQWYGGAAFSRHHV